MNATSPSDLSRQASSLLARSVYDPKKLVLLHVAVSLGATLLVTGMNYFFSLQIADTGGLAGLGIRSVLTTVQSTLEFLVTVLLPFWEIGILYAALHWAYGEHANPKDLLQGFRRFRSVLGLRLLQGGLFLALGIALLNISSFLFTLTPYAAPVEELLQPLLTSSDPESLLTEEWMEAMTQATIPLFVFVAVVFAIMAIPLFYRLRFAEYAVMEGTPALRAIVRSFTLTRDAWRHILRADLYFWWFYLLQMLTVAISYGDSILGWLGIPLPLTQDSSFFLFYAAGILCQGLLLWQCQGKILTTYCLLYRGVSPHSAPDFQKMPPELP